MNEKKIILSVLKKLLEQKQKRVTAAPIGSNDMRKSLDILKKDHNFDDFKKQFYTLRDTLAEKTNLSQEQASSLINYALHAK